jgi:ATP synthase protein I
LAGLNVARYNLRPMVEEAMPGAEDPQNEAAERANLDALAAALRARRPTAAPNRSPSESANGDGFGSAMSLGLRAGSEFVAAILVGAAIGLGIDWLFHTRPLFTILFFLLGVAAATLNVIRAASPNGAAFIRTSRLSEPKGEDKDVPRNGTPGG